MLVPEVWTQILRYCDRAQVLSLRASSVWFNNLVKESRVIVPNFSIIDDRATLIITVGNESVVKRMDYEEFVRQKENGLEHWIFTMNMFSVQVKGTDNDKFGKMLETALKAFQLRSIGPAQLTFRVDFRPQFAQLDYNQFRDWVELINHCPVDFPVQLHAGPLGRFNINFKVKLGSKFFDARFRVESKEELSPWEWAEFDSGHELSYLQLSMKDGRSAREFARWLHNMRITVMDLTNAALYFESPAVLEEVGKIQVDGFHDKTHMGAFFIPRNDKDAVNWTIKELTLNNLVGAITDNYVHMLESFTFPQLRKLTINTSDLDAFEMLGPEILRSLLANLTYLDMNLSGWKFVHTFYADSLASLKKLRVSGLESSNDNFNIVQIDSLKNIEYLTVATNSRGIQDMETIFDNLATRLLQGHKHLRELMFEFRRSRYGKTFQ
uniref:ARAD1C44990p n=1 Tax=Blastobotrys adeninivorans TaxID=409370 RepID=A0A060T418_BLAAD